MPDARHEYGEGKEPIPAINAPTVIFMINKSLQGDSWTDEQVYQATRCAWSVGPKTREQAVYALGVSHGVVRGAYRIDRWHDVDGKHWCFDGVPATDLDVIDTSVARFKSRQGARSSFRKFLGGIPDPTPVNQ